MKIKVTTFAAENLRSQINNTLINIKKKTLIQIPWWHYPCFFFHSFFPLFKCFYDTGKDFPVAQTVKNLPAMQETWVWSLVWEVPLEKEMATHSSILVWRIPWTESLVGYSPWVCKELDTTEWLIQYTLYCNTGEWVPGNQTLLLGPPPGTWHWTLR